jgi:acetyltransferase-like isoleucine patch superfamily enzyme
MNLKSPQLWLSQKMYLSSISSRVLIILYKKIVEIFNKANELEKFRNCQSGLGTRLYPSSEIFNPSQDKSSISIGSYTHVRGELFLYPNGEAIKIGDDCHIGNNTKIWAMASITIGDRVLISHDVNIHDNNAHSFSAKDRHLHFKTITANGHPMQTNNISSEAVLIEDDAWIGFGSTILKGVTVGRGSIIGANAVVTKDVAPYTVVVGNPARIVGKAAP